MKKETTTPDGRLFKDIRKIVLHGRDLLPGVVIPACEYVAPDGEIEIIPTVHRTMTREEAALVLTLIDINDYKVILERFNEKSEEKKKIQKLLFNKKKLVKKFYNLTIHKTGLSHLINGK